MAQNREAYLVSYDVDTVPPTALIEELKNSIGWWHYLDRTWIIVRNETIYELQDLLDEKLGTQGRLLIITARTPVGGWLPKKAYDWIRRHVPDA